MVPHQKLGTHIIIIIKFKVYAFLEKARKTMAKKLATKNDATMFKCSSVDDMFNLVKTEKGVIITFGKFKVSMKSFRTFKEADEYIASKPYEILINVSVLIAKFNQEDEKNQDAAKNGENAESSK